MKYFRPILLLIIYPLMVLGMVFDNNKKNNLLAEEYIQSNERDIFETLGDEEKKNNPLPANPMELMYLLQRSSAMDDATSPSDAIDQALESLNHDENF